MSVFISLCLILQYELSFKEESQSLILTNFWGLNVQGIAKVNVAVDRQGGITWLSHF
jgi:hypothetical protein